MSYEAALAGALWVLGSWVVYTSVLRMAALTKREINTTVAAIISSMWPVIAFYEVFYFTYLYGRSVMRNSQEKPR